MKKGILAKLLAKENITIQHGNYQTAWFDIKNRVLGLPLWKDLGNDVYDLLIGHEVGHALETPFAGWHDSPEKLEGCPRSYINVIEDARIERKIKSRYPGLVRSFVSGYKKLFEQGFFGEGEYDWPKIKLIDKINLHAKVGAHVDVPFNKAEQELMDRTMATDTFEDVLQVVRDVLAYSKENQEDLMKPQEQETAPREDGDENEDPSGNMGHDDQESDQDESESVTKNDFTDNEDINDESEEEMQVANPEPQGGGEVSITDEIFRGKEDSLLDIDKDGQQKVVVNQFTKPTLSKIRIPYKKLAEARKERVKRNLYAYDWNERRPEFQSFIKEARKNINYAVKEFEMRKAAFRYTRAQTAKTGSIDVNKLWSYKTNDDIFSRVTQLADAKNHGLYMLVDYSGSMSSTMKHVQKQLIHCVMFCKAVNIPFVVYGVSSTNWELGYEGIADGEMHHGQCSMPEIISSNLNKKDYEEALYHMFCRTYGYANHFVNKNSGSEEWVYESDYLAAVEDWGSTPFVEALHASHFYMKEFQAQNNIEKMSLVVMSDGESNGPRLYHDENLDIERTKTSTYARYSEDVIFKLDGKKVEGFNLSGKDGTKSLTRHFQKQGINTLGFFISNSNWEWKSKISDIYYENSTDDDYYGYDDMRKKFQKEYAKNKCVTVKDYAGYNEYYVVKSGQALDTDNGELVVNEDASKGQITSAFKKFSRNKKSNKVLLTNFGAAVA